MGENAAIVDVPTNGGNPESGISRTITTDTRVEVDGICVVERVGRSVAGWCPQCGATVVLVAPDDAATLVNKSTRSIYQHIESGAIHWAERPDTFLLVCLRSVLEQAGRTLPWQPGERQP